MSAESAPTPRLRTRFGGARRAAVGRHYPASISLSARRVDFGPHGDFGANRSIAWSISYIRWSNSCVNSRVARALASSLGSIS